MIENGNFSLVCVGRRSIDLEIPEHTLLEEFNAMPDLDNVEGIIARHNPDFILNALGFVKQRKSAFGAVEIFCLNSIFPKKLESLIVNTNIKMIQFSTDCVFDGAVGNYRETDFPNATDDYGVSKFLGEITNNRNVLTLRTSFIGHEVKNRLSLLEWFLQQNEIVSGYKRVIYGGLPTVEITRVIIEYILNNFHHGLYHLGGYPIAKFELLCKIKRAYRLDHIKIIPEDEIISNRTLNSQKFQDVFHYKLKLWDELIEDMHTNSLTRNK